MKIIYKKGDLLDCEEAVIMQGCNSKGVMGAGIAKLIRADCPKLYYDYRDWCLTGNRTGQIIWH
jgi:O-acetyl-ADP-ribose deacetylase (regulator of RNase III)